MNYFEFYNIPETLHPDGAMLRKKWQEASRVYHPDRYRNATPSEQLEALQKSSLNNEAYRTLKDEEATLAYLLRQYSVLATDEKYVLPQAFLMAMMDLNDAAESGQLSATGYQAAEDEANGLMEPLATRFQNGERSPQLLNAMKDVYFRKKYLHRLKERLA